MPILARHLALAACLTLLGSAADAEANRRGRPRKVAKAKYDAPRVDRDEDENDEDDDEDEDEDEDADASDEDEEEETDDEDDDEADERDRRKAKKKARRKAVAAESDSEIDAPAKVRKRGVKAGLRDWNFAIGPNVWMASVDANVAVGDKSVGTAIDFFQLSRHTRYGVPVLAEARYKRFTFAADLLYGVVDVAGANEVGPLMVSLDATVSSLLVDGLAGFRFLDNSHLTLEARAGIRYQRTAISGSVDLGGSGFSPKAIVDAGGDFLAGARVEVRPFKRFYLSGTVDQSLVGSSTSTWSAGAELNVRIVSRVLLAVGWRTLTQQRAAISTVMHGPRAAVQLLF